MKIHIHRGQNQIGGSIVEVSSKSTRLFFDVGVNLNENDSTVVPDIEGVFKGDKDCNAIFISHYHADHFGLLGNRGTEGQEHCLIPSQNTGLAVIKGTNKCVHNSFLDCPIYPMVI